MSNVTFSRILYLLGLLVLVFAILAKPNLAEAQVSGFTEIETTLSDPQKNLAVYTGIDEKLNEYWKLSSFFLVTNGWGEGYVGPTYSLGTSFSLNLSAGVEQGPNGLTPRYATSLWMMSGNLSFLGILEVDNAVLSKESNAGLWYDLNLNYQAKDWLSVGLKDRRPVGLGPVIQLSSRGNDFWLQWAAISSEEAEIYPYRFLLGMKHNF